MAGASRRAVRAGGLVPAGWAFLHGRERGAVRRRVATRSGPQLQLVRAFASPSAVGEPLPIDARDRAPSISCGRPP